MPAFFIPEPGLEGTSDEVAYAALRKDVREGTGHEPYATRIFKLSYRRGGADCEVEVGKPDPLSGQTVVAILDLGRHGPYLIECRPPRGQRHRHLVEKPVYAVTEFTA